MNNIQFDFSTSENIVILLGVFVSAFIFVLWSRNIGKGISTIEEYFLADKKVSDLSLHSTNIGTNITFTNILIALSAFGYLYGVMSFWIVIFWVLGMFFFSYHFPKIAPFFKNGNTLHQYLGSAFKSEKLQKVASIATIVAFIGTLALEIYGATYLVQKLGFDHGSLSVGVASGLAIALILYTTNGGYKAILATDKVQLVMIVVCIGIVSYAFANLLNTVPETTASLKNSFTLAAFTKDPIWIFSMFILFFPFQFCVMDMWQRCASINGNIPRVRKMLSFDSIGFIIAFSIPILIGLSLKDTSLITNEYDSFFYPLIQSLDFILTLVLFIGLVGIMFSTADTLLLCSAYSFTYDCWLNSKTFDTKSQKEQNKLLASVKSWVVVFGFLSVVLILVMNYISLNDLILAVFSAQVVFFIPLLIAMFKPQYAAQKGKAAYYAIWVGIVTPIICVLAGQFIDIRELVDGAPILGFIFTLITIFVIKKN